MKIQHGKTYKCKNGDVFTIKKNNLPYYCFSVDKAHSFPTNEHEVWTEEGIAYHDDCGYNFVEEINK